ncbi:MAG TPA: VOC family protein [Acidimicrobiales bacterium]|nr:VOC family protein [Acidimicrobiales bacterium]
MADPFEALLAPVAPVEPDPAFAARLRARIERALTLPKGVTVSNLTLEPEPATSERATTEPTASSAASTSVEAPTSRPLAAIVPYLAVAGAGRALEWYAEALGARTRGEPYVMPDGSIGHAELEIEGGLLMLSEQHPEIGVVAPAPGEGVPVTIHLSVDDVDSVIDRAVAAGADLERAPADYDYGRNGVFRDPFGHRWLVSAAPADSASTTVRHGDIGYVSLQVPDTGRAAEFFSSVLGWRYGPASGPQGRQVEGQSLHHGIWGEQPRTTLFLCFAVADIASAVVRVRDAGGTAEEPQAQPYGLVSTCSDDQGTAFAIFEPPGGIGTGGGAPALHGTLHGDVAYITMEVVDSARTRAFYGSVLGWRFERGHVEDGWQVENVAPMVGISGGHETDTTVPMYRVHDIEVAVERVRARGGTATDPEVQPYGTTSTCTDDQGTRFYLGQL